MHERSAAGKVQVFTGTELEYSFARLFVPWNIHSHDGTFVLGTIRSLKLSFPGPFVPDTEYYAQNSFP